MEEFITQIQGYFTKHNRNKLLSQGGLEFRNEKTIKELAVFILHLSIIHLSVLYMEKAMATHSRVLAWRIPGMVEAGGLPSLG